MASLAGILGALTWKETLDDDEEQSRAKLIHEKLKKKRAIAKRRDERAKRAKVIHHRDGTTSVKVKLAEKFIIPMILLSRESAVRQSRYRRSKGSQRCTGCRFNKDGFCQQHDFYLENGGYEHTCNEWQRRR